MPARTHPQTCTQGDRDHLEEQADLERLAASLTRRGLQADICLPAGRLPYLDVRNPAASILTERVYAQAGSYWYSWCERIAGCEQPDAAAAALARVLRTADID